MRAKKAEIPMRIIFLGPMTLIGLCIFLRQSLDLRDRPGAAGTRSIYHASPSTPPSKDWPAMLIEWSHTQFDLPLDMASSLVSFAAVFIGLVGLTMAGFAVDGRRGAMGAGLVGATWSLTGYMAILDGIDPLTFGIAWFAVGMCWMSGSATIWSILFGIMGAAAAPFAVTLKETALPAVALCILTPLFIRPSKWLLLSIPGAAYSLYWSYAWFWPEEASRLKTSLPDAASIRHGWFLLKNLAYRGLPEGKFDQFIVLSLLSGVIPIGHWWKRLLIGISSSAAICFTAHTLDELVRPRYLTVASFGLLVCVGTISGRIISRKNRWTALPLAIILVFNLLDGWAFMDAWAEKRRTITGASELNWPNPPDLWQRQFKNMTDLTLRDLTLWGGVELAVLSSTHPNGLAIPRLRDDRHFSLSGLAQIYQIPHVIVDPGNCCKGRHADASCAAQVMSELQTAGITMVIPTAIKGVQRMHKVEENWRMALLKAAESYSNRSESDYWTVIEAPKPESTERPCQKKAPFRRPK